MADARIGKGPFFERGIERIVDAPDAGEMPLLPDAHELAPSVLPQQAALAQLLHAENLESLLDAWARPELVERELLAPQRFRAAMKAALERLRRAANVRRGADLRVSKLLDCAASVLDEDIELRELLLMYRSALLQG